MRDRLIELIEKEVMDYASWITEMALQSSYNIPSMAEVIADKILADGWMRPPCKVGDWIWYVYRNEINKAKVEEIHYDASKHGYYSYSFSIYAYDFKNKRQVAYYPTNETQKNKSNINEIEGMDFDEDVCVFITREEAEAKMKEGGEG